MAGPRYVHDCCRCVYLGAVPCGFYMAPSYEWADASTGKQIVWRKRPHPAGDVWVCPAGGTVVIRTGPSGPDYSSWEQYQWAVPDQVRPAVRSALRHHRARSRKVLSDARRRQARERRRGLARHNGDWSAYFAERLQLLPSDIA